MGSPLTFRLAIAPTGKARPRERGRLPTKYRNWKKQAAGLLCAQLILGRWPKATDPHRHLVRVSVHAVHTRRSRPPQWMTAQERAAWRAGWSPPRLATPDTDNMAGAVMDALNDTSLCWVDDAQAEIASVTSTWAAVGEPAHIVVTLERVAWEVPS